jgi:hypothetical protein
VPPRFYLPWSVLLAHNQQASHRERQRANERVSCSLCVVSEEQTKARRRVCALLSSASVFIISSRGGAAGCIRSQAATSEREMIHAHNGGGGREEVGVVGRSGGSALARRTGHRACGTVWGSRMRCRRQGCHVSSLARSSCQTRHRVCVVSI